jgi:hypothetical protein
LRQVRWTTNACLDLGPLWSILTRKSASFCLFTGRCGSIDKILQGTSKKSKTWPANASGDPQFHPGIKKLKDFNCIPGKKSVNEINKSIFMHPKPQHGFRFAPGKTSKNTTNNNMRTLKASVKSQSFFFQ